MAPTKEEQSNKKKHKAAALAPKQKQPESSSKSKQKTKVALKHKAKAAQKQKKEPLFTRAERNWVFFDMGHAAISMFNTAVVPIYAASLAVAGISSAEIVGTWGITQTIASLIVALLMPILGSLADYKGQKIKFLVAFSLICIGAAFLEVLPLSYVPFLVVYVLMIIGMNSVRTFYDAMLVDVTTDKRMNNVSSLGFGLAYITSVIPFILCILLIFFGPTMFGLDKAACTRLGFGISGLWMLVFALPLFFTYHQKYGKKRKSIGKEIQKTFTGLGKTMKTMMQDKRLLYFLLGFFFYIDAVYTVIAMATNYGAALGIDENHLILALLATQFVAFPSTILYGLLADKYGTRKLIIVAIFGYMGIVTFGTFFLKGPVDFWILALLVGVFQGGIQALSRSFFGRIISKKKSNEYFGFFNVFGAFARVLGTAMVSFFTFLTGNPSVGVFSIMILLVFGLVFMLLMPKEGLQGEEVVR